jgi:hypothetical protein
MKRSLSKRDEQFCLEVAKGETLTSAYIISRPRCDPGEDALQRKYTGTRASKLAAKPSIRERIEAIRKASKVNDLSSLGTVMGEIIRNTALAADKGDFKAAMAGLRLQAQMLGGLTTQMVIMEETAGDHALVERLAKGQPELANQLKSLLSAEDFGSDSGGPTVQ